MKHVLCVAGLPVFLYDRLKRESAKRFVPDGRLIAKPLVHSKTYSVGAARNFALEAAEYVSSLPESEPLSMLLLYVDYRDRGSEQFVEMFFPFSLAAPINLPNFDGMSSKNEMNRKLNDFVSSLERSALRLRRAGDAVKGALSGNNLTPLLLPIRNFHSQHLVPNLKNLFLGLIDAPAPERAIQDVCENLIRHHPWTKPPRDSQRCLTDGILYFKSPGSARHGYFRHRPNPTHQPECLLKARSRLGGPFNHTFH